jgi:tetratricopeptide (TPR) repeat protein
MHDYRKKIFLHSFSYRFDFIGLTSCAGFYNNRGNAYSVKGEFDQAISDYTKAIELNPKLDFAYSNRGNAYKDKGQFDEAITDYSRAIELYNSQENAHELFGRLEAFHDQRDA